MLVKVFGCACFGIDAQLVTIEVDVGQGINFYLVGLPDVAVRESQQRIFTALESIGRRPPGKKIVVNMAPADLRKEGSAYDLPIALGILAASDQLDGSALSSFVCMGELALDGQLREVKGGLAIAAHAKEAGFAACVLPEASACEAAAMEGIAVYGARHISQVIDLLEGRSSDLPLVPLKLPQGEVSYAGLPDFAQVKGQCQAKRALEVAASGGHNVLLCGSPGSGKTFMAKCLPGILPPLTTEEAMETTKIYSVAGLLGAQPGLIRTRPFRSPHHSLSVAALTGGGNRSLPGELSLAHNGVLYLDELPEFSKQALEVLRQPLEDRCIHISRVKYKVSYPASFMLVASMNPCPCGYKGHPQKDCVCNPYQVIKYRNRISGPLMDRMDMQLHVQPVAHEEMFSHKPIESSAAIRARVAAARERQLLRYAGQKNLFTNAQLPPALIESHCAATEDARRFLRAAVERMGCSARATHRIMRMARTVADLDGAELVGTAHIAEALQYR